MLTDAGTVQEGEVIPVYLSQTTFRSIAEMFPYLTDRSKATGGGFVSNLDFRIFDKTIDTVNADTIFEEGFDVCGVRVVPLEGQLFIARKKWCFILSLIGCGVRHDTCAVHHGVYLAPPRYCASAFTPRENERSLSPPEFQPKTPDPSETKSYGPFLCHGFV